MGSRSFIRLDGARMTPGTWRASSNGVNLSRCTRIGRGEEQLPCEAETAGGRLNETPRREQGGQANSPDRNSSPVF